MDEHLIALFEAQGGVATSAQILRFLTRRRFDKAVSTGVLERLWQGIYCLGEPTDELRLRGLDLICGRPVAVCLATAAAMFGFDTEQPAELHVLDSPPCGLRDADGLVVHRRDGAPLVRIDDRRVTSPAWTAIEVARGLRRPRALATLDAALRSETCTRADLWRAAIEQKGRRGIVAVRDLLAIADPRAESPMESEARLEMLDGGLPVPELQYEILDGNGDLRRLDFAWPDRRVAAEYDGVAWHSGPEAMIADRRRFNALADVDWTVVPIVFDDVRYRAWEMVARIDRQLTRARAA
ncbi:type IV toxin-antitoxin system AbiEi family antitoxin domain-containing protein [Mycolicibacterium sp. 3033]|nr:type IV toxin-antitoxin system AbiEi family antitoxin domain-containing protein [Mycolicibacterium aurantiacum]